MREHDRQLAVALERPLSCEAFEQNAAERVDVGARVDLAPVDLLRRYVVDRPDEAAITGEAADRGDVAGQPEVANVRVLDAAPFRDEDVRRLDVPVHEIRRVRCVEGLGDLIEERERTRRRQPLLASEQVAEVATVDVSHREVEHSAGVPGRDGGDDVRMVEARCELRLAQEPLPEALVFSELRREQLEGDAATATRVHGDIDGSDRAFADQRLHAEVSNDITGVEHGRQTVSPRSTPLADSVDPSGPRVNRNRRRYARTRSAVSSLGDASTARAIQRRLYALLDADA